ncbi:MAG: hypothetical protein HYX92_21460 [Chloroflexi bacterium]|nr:hypothetical protein [Chloroflexota bacterium]
MDSQTRLGLTNVMTSVNGRVDSDTNVPKSQMDELIQLARDFIPYDAMHAWSANINGIVVQLVTNSDHLIDFWIENWFPISPDVVRPHGVIYAVNGISGMEPHAYYCSEVRTAVFVNTDYYGQCKSWALGIAADIMEMQHDIHSIHAAVVDIGGSGIAIIAPTGTGKSTQSYGLVLRVPNARMHSDDWAYVDYIGGIHGRASATISERKFYLRTDIAETYPRMAEAFRRCKLENVGDTYSAIRNSRVILDPMWIGGPEKFIYTTRLRSVVLLRRDERSPAEEKLDTEDAIDTLRKGEFMVLPGGGPEEEWGKIKTEPFYNPYLLVKNEERTQLQVDFFRRLFKFAPCYILNTGVETIEQTHTRMLRIAEEATQRAFSEE